MYGFNIILSGAGASDTYAHSLPSEGQTFETGNTKRTKANTIRIDVPIIESKAPVFIKKGIFFIPIDRFASLTILHLLGSGNLAQIYSGKVVGIAYCNRFKSLIKK
jgi:hypothetical protein